MIIDDVTCKHGDSPIEFLVDVNYAIENVKITLEFNNFTSITSKRNSIVDYVVTEAENLHNVAEYRVWNVNNFLCEISALHPAFAPTKISHHSIILPYT